jgi:LysM repeat protein
LYSIAREYNINIKDLKDWNDLPGNNLSVGQVLALKKTDTSSGTKESSNKNIKHSGKTHTVSASETLYSISRTYNISVEDLKSWNNLSSSEISIGQSLVLKNPDSTPQNEVLASTKKETESSSTVNKADQKPEINRNATASNASVEMNPSKPAKKKVESGIAEVIEGTAETKKYLALHRTAPIGTIMQVKNEMNNQSVFVRVVGKVPDTGDNNGILIKISKKAYDRLGAVDAKFPVVISYIP